MILSKILLPLMGIHQRKFAVDYKCQNGQGRIIHMTATINCGPKTTDEDIVNHIKGGVYMSCGGKVYRIMENKRCLYTLSEDSCE